MSAPSRPPRSPYALSTPCVWSVGVFHCAAALFPLHGLKHKDNNGSKIVMALWLKLQVVAFLTRHCGLLILFFFFFFLSHYNAQGDWASQSERIRRNMRPLYLQLLPEPDKSFWSGQQQCLMLMFSFYYIFVLMLKWPSESCIQTCSVWPLKNKTVLISFSIIQNHNTWQFIFKAGYSKWNCLRSTRCLIPLKRFHEEDDVSNDSLKIGNAHKEYKFGWKNWTR